ncbi:MAG: histidinol-phosphate transaminase [Candidatus Magasanikbacteria bacterium]
MKNLANQNIQVMNPYNPPIEGRRYFDGCLLDFNERTTPYGDVVKKALEKLTQENVFQRYPEYGDINERIAQYASTRPKNIMIINGSDQGIDIIFKTFTKPGDEVIIPSPSFAMFYQCAELCGNKIITPTYNTDNGSFPLQDVLNAITDKTKLVVVCNPNNPTGTQVSPDDIERILKKLKNGLVYVDEAYAEYSGITAIPLIEKYPNLVITRTFSKAFGLAALRIGYVIAPVLLIREMAKVRGPYDINMAGLYTARAVLQNLQPLKIYIQQVMKVSKPMLEQFFRENGVMFYPSSAHFILFRPKNPAQIFNNLRERGFLIRPRKGYGFDNTVRVSMGTVGQTKQFIETYKSLINQ